MYVLKLNKILDGNVGYREFIPTLGGRTSQEQIDAADRKGRKTFDAKQMAILYELVQCLDKKLGACCVRGINVLRCHVYKN